MVWPALPRAATPPHCTKPYDRLPVNYAIVYINLTTNCIYIKLQRTHSRKNNNKNKNRISRVSPGKKAAKHGRGWSGEVVTGRKLENCWTANRKQFVQFVDLQRNDVLAV